MPFLADVFLVLYLNDCGGIEDTHIGSFFGDKDADYKQSEAWTYAAVVLTAISFMHCKNEEIVVEDATESDGPPEKWLRRQKQPKLRYSKVRIKPGRKVFRRPAAMTARGVKMGEHGCRGHFKRYTEVGTGMFGRRIFGTFWCPPHQRGSADAGVVRQEYHVEAPQVQETVACARSRRATAYPSSKVCRCSSSGATAPI